jgi:hypothetical protein
VTGLSNLPPGCSSPDGGIDHAYEEAIEAFTEIAVTAEDVKIINACAGAILDAVRDSYKSGLEDAATEYQIAEAGS